MNVIFCNNIVNAEAFSEFNWCFGGLIIFDIKILHELTNCQYEVICLAMKYLTF
jgi:hypothetical protein